MATSADIEFVCGEDITIEVTVTGVDITGWTLSFAVARSYGDAAIIPKTTAGGITITDGANGVFEVTIGSTDTDDLSAGGYVWDVKRSDAGQEACLTRGKLNLKPKVAA